MKNLLRRYKIHLLTPLTPILHKQELILVEFILKTINNLKPFTRPTLNEYTHYSTYYMNNKGICILQYMYKMEWLYINKEFIITLKEKFYLSDDDIICILRDFVKYKLDIIIPIDKKIDVIFDDEKIEVEYLYQQPYKNILSKIKNNYKLTIKDKKVIEYIKSCFVDLKKVKIKRRDGCYYYKNTKGLSILEFYNEHSWICKEIWYELDEKFKLNREDINELLIYFIQNILNISMEGILFNLEI